MMYPGLFLIGFGGHWENEPGNDQIIHINPSQVVYVSDHKRGESDAVTHFAMHIHGEPFPFIVHESELQLVAPDDGGATDN